MHPPWGGVDSRQGAWNGVVASLHHDMRLAKQSLRTSLVQGAEICLGVESLFGGYDEFEGLPVEVDGDEGRIPFSIAGQ